jgi:hypothetical protein
VRQARANLAKDGKELGWVAAPRVVGADIGLLDDPFWAYYLPSWHRQCPARLAVHGGEVETTFYFTGAQLSGSLPTRAKRASDLPATVDEAGER